MRMSKPVFIICKADISIWFLLQASLTYAEAQMRIDSATMNDDITVSLRGLNKLAKILKKRRIEKGYISKIFIKIFLNSFILALRSFLNSSKVFYLDSDKLFNRLNKNWYIKTPCP